MIAFTLWMFIGFIWLIKFHPTLYVRRLEAGPSAEQSLTQKVIATCLFALLGVMFILPGLDRRYGWSHVKWQFTVFGLIGSFLGLILVVGVALHNEYMAASITVESTQKVITTGPYAIVRHPMEFGFSLHQSLWDLGALWRLSFRSSFCSYGVR
jgi:protein-S-isoprenylcysteine O-methyltransferase Ste14